MMSWSSGLPSRITGPCTAKPVKIGGVAAPRLHLAAVGVDHPAPGADFFLLHSPPLRGSGQRHLLTANAPRLEDFREALGRRVVEGAFPFDDCDVVKRADEAEHVFAVVGKRHGPLG